MPIGAFRLNTLSAAIAAVVTTGDFVLKKIFHDPNAYSTSASDFFGISVSTSDNYAIVGAYGEGDAGGTNSGKAYIYSTSTGSLLYTLDNPNAYSTSSSDSFGYSVGISNNYAIVGAYGEDDAGGLSSGKAYIYSTSTGSLLYTLDNPNAYSTSANDSFGYSVSISDNYAIVGAYGEGDAGGTISGKAYIYSTSTGSLLYTLNNPNAYSTSANDFFGNSVSISDNYAIVGAYQEDDAGGTSSGKAYIYSTSTGSLLYTLNNPNAYSTSASDFFGYSVGISNNYAIVGAYGEDDASGASSGKAYIYSTSTGSLLYTLDNPNAYNISTTDLFGYSVGISNNYAIVGAYQEGSAIGSISGKAYMYSNYLDTVSPLIISVLTSTTSLTTTITIPSTAAVNDYAILFDTSTTVTNTLPTGFTSIVGTTTTGIRTNVSYKKLVAGDPGALITGMAGATRKILLILRPNKTVSTVTISTPNAQATTAVPTNQTLNMTGQTAPCIGFAVYSSTGSITTRGNTAINPIEYSLISTTSIYVKTVQFNPGETPGSYTISMTDGGTNVLQSFYITFA